MRFVIDSKGNLVKIGKNMKKKEIVEIPSNTRFISEEVFANCDSIKEIKIPSGVTKIDHHAFACCRRLSKVEIPDSVYSIGSSTFLGCYGLEKVTLPENIEIIFNHLFYDCGNLEYLYFPQSIREIKEQAFYRCSSLDNVMLPNNIDKIERGAFEKCVSLRSIVVPSKVKVIEEETFKNCTSLETVKLPKNLIKIEKSAFDSCTDLEDIEIPSSIKEIEEKAFFNTALYGVKLPDTIEKLSYDAFGECYNIKNFTFGDKKLDNIHNLIGLKKPSYFESLFIGDELLNESIFYLIHFDNRNNITPISNSLIASTIFNKSDINRIKEMSSLLPLIIGKNINEDNYEQIKHELKDNYKEFNNLLKRLSEQNDIFKEYPNRLKYYDLYRFARLLGAFNDNQVERQKACEFIKNAFDKEQLVFFTLHSTFEGLEFNDYDKELAEFLMDKNNFEALMDAEKDGYGMTAKICNSFDKIKEFGRKNRGAQNYRKVTIEMCQRYFSTGEFVGVDETNEDISLSLYKFTREQSTFETAVEIRKKFDKLKGKKKVSEHILNEELSSKIEEMRKSSLENITSTLTNLSNASSRNFTYEFLAKSDPLNFVLGKYCSCCAHLEGAGKGIVKASILHPDCQNLIIKNSEGKVIAKSTLYVNRTQGYGVFNNIEVNESLEEETKQEIYDKYKEAIEAFARRYNAHNQNNPIRQINVGMNLNDLESIIKDHDEKSKSILKGFNFAEFGNYSGDWQDEQYVLWRISEESKAKLKKK